jgi:hypothetical protein
MGFGSTERWAPGRRSREGGNEDVSARKVCQRSEENDTSPTTSYLCRTMGRRVSTGARVAGVYFGSPTMRPHPTRHQVTALLVLLIVCSFFLNITT